MKKIFATLMMAAALTMTMLGGLVGCKNKDNVIRLTEVTHSVFYAPLYIALNEGYFEDEGLVIELSNGGGADKCMTAIISGQADIGLMGPEAAIYVYNEGREDYPVIFAQLTKKDGSFLMSRTNETNFSWDTMQDKEVLGGRRGGVPAMALEFALNKANAISQRGVTINYDVQFDLIIPAFESGTADYCTMFEPAASNYVREGKGYKIASVGQQAGDMPFTAFMASSSYITKNRANVDAFTRAIVKGMKFLTENTAQAVAKVVAPSFVGTSEELLADAIEAYKEIDAYSETPIMKQADFEKLQDVIIASGVMTKRADFSKLFNTEIASKLLG